MLVQQHARRGRSITELDAPGTHEPIQDVLGRYDSLAQALRWPPLLYIR